jgi:hypothetical protein
LGFSEAFAGALDAVLFAATLTGFIGSSQHNSSHVSQIRIDSQSKQKGHILRIYTVHLSFLPKKLPSKKLI